MVDYIDGRNHSFYVMGAVASVVDYDTGRECDGGVVAVIFGAGACAIYGGG